MAKAFQYFEVTFPQDILDAHEGKGTVGVMRALLDEYIAETDAKEGKVLREFVIDGIAAFQWKENVGAYSMEFMSERNRQNYGQARAAFSAWLETKGVVTSYTLSHDIPNDIANQLTNGEFPESTYYNIAKDYMTFEIPSTRGFTPLA